MNLFSPQAGPYLPTGSPVRQLVLEVQAEEYGSEHFREERVYASTVADSHGTVLMREHFAFLRAVKVVSDTRLAPGDNHGETFSFRIPAASQAQVKATFWYYYSPMARTESQRRITFLTMNRLAPPVAAERKK